jgi:ATP-dependent Clp endopeptidase proteolytic subunit ClpP
MESNLLSPEPLPRPLTPEEIELVKARTVQLETMTADQHAFNLVTLEKAKEEARIVSLELAKAERTEIAHNADDLYNRYYVFDHEVSSKSVALCLQRLNYWHRTQPGCDIEIVIHSEGGSIPDGFALFDRITQLRNQGHHVTTRALGVAASMGAILVQAGDVRSMGEQSWLLLHEGGYGAQGTAGAQKDMADWFGKLQEHLAKIIVDRAAQAGENGTAKKPLTMAQFKKGVERKDWWISSKDALEMGLVDEVV